MATILVIEDDGHVRMAIEHCLKKSGHAVLIATDGKEGIRHVHKNTIDLVVTDLFMDGQEGLETIRILRKKHPKIPVIAMSGGNPASETMLQVATELGAQHVLSKPFWSKGLLDAVDKALAVCEKENS